MTQGQISELQEERIAEILGGKRVKGSGSGKLNKQDVESKHALLQLKRTKGESLTVNKGDLIKLEQDALNRGKIPLFVMGFGEYQTEDWICVPAWFLKGDCGAAFLESMKILRDL